MGSWFSREEKPQGTGTINDLTDSDLESVFKHLPLHDRLMASAVCQRWYGVSRIPWRDVTSINLTLISIQNLGAIIKQCPNLKSVIAVGTSLDSKAVHLLFGIPLSSVKLYKNYISVPVLDTENADPFALFSESLLNTTWQELVLVDVCALAEGPYCNRFVAEHLPPSLERLQLCSHALSSWKSFCFQQSLTGFDLLNDLGRLQNLTCLILYGFRDTCLIEVAWFTLVTIRELRKLKNLRELCIGDNRGLDIFAHQIGNLCLPKLQVLFLLNVVYYGDAAVGLAQLITTHPCLRILVLTGNLWKQLTIPARRLYPNGYDTEPLPLLHVFVDKSPSERIRFTKLPSAALKISPVSKPLPAFLDREEIAPIFGGVWIAAQIREGAKHGASWCNSATTAATSIRVVDDE